MYIFFLIKFKNKNFLRLHREYSLLNEYNYKSLNHKINFFIIKRRVKRFIYELKLFLK